jgi:hypothetical protein
MRVQGTWPLCIASASLALPIAIRYSGANGSALPWGPILAVRECKFLKLALQRVAALGKHCSKAGRCSEQSQLFL